MLMPVAYKGGYRPRIVVQSHLKRNSHFVREPRSLGAEGSQEMDGARRRTIGWTLT